VLVMELSGLEGKNAVVTGGSRGIGKAIVRVLAKNGVRVICCARNENLLKSVCETIVQEGGIAMPVKADLALAGDRKELVRRALSEFGAIDFLVNNAGIHVEKESFELTDEEMLRAIDINLLSMFSLCRDFGKQMVQRGGGKIVNVGSFWGRLGVSKQLAYCVSKAGIEALTRCLAVEWARYNIQVNTVAPGHIMTDISKTALEDEKLRNAILRRIPARRVGEPEEVAYLVAFLCSQESNYITGHTYCIDGGQQISW